MITIDQKNDDEYQLAKTLFASLQSHGVILTSKLAEYLMKQGMHEEWIKKAIHQIDANNDGHLTWAEFATKGIRIVHHLRLNGVIGHATNTPASPMFFASPNLSASPNMNAAAHLKFQQNFGSVSNKTPVNNAFQSVDDALDRLIDIASSLKGKIGTTKGAFEGKLFSYDVELKKVYGDIEMLHRSLESATFSNKEECDSLERQLKEKETKKKSDLKEYDIKIKEEINAREQVECERKAAQCDVVAERVKFENLLKDTEEDAACYNRLRPSKPVLTDEDRSVLRQLFLSSAVSGSGKVSFADLQKVLSKYADKMPEGPLRKLFMMVEKDKKSRLSYITLVAVASDLAALVGDFCKIDTNSNGILSRKEFHEHFAKLGFSKKSMQDALFRYADADDSDDIGFLEYVHLNLCLLVLRILFAFADYDKSGQLSKDEVKRVLDDAEIPESARKKFEHKFKVVDADESHSLSYHEFTMLVLLMFYDD